MAQAAVAADDELELTVMLMLGLEGLNDGATEARKREPDILGERCEWTDLHIIACGHCLGHPDANDYGNYSL